MPKVNLFWNPAGFELDSLGTKQLTKISDGDTPQISFSIRMLSIDTPEVHYPGTQSPAKQDEKFAQLAQWIAQGKVPIDEDLGKFLRPKLATGAAGTLQKQQGDLAAKAFQDLLDAKLTKPNGRKRSVFLRTADEKFDQYGRVLAYVAPSYESEELVGMTPLQRATFNLLMVENGWAAPFPIFPSLPRYSDLVLFQAVAEDAKLQKRGTYADPLSLTGYEFRMCVRLWEVTNDLDKGKKLSESERSGWIERFCVDMTTRQVFFPQDYHKVEPFNRVFIWPKDANDAVGKLNLTPA
jgi:endonuclease YncB( thermonuclease family)